MAESALFTVFVVTCEAKEEAHLGETQELSNFVQKNDTSDIR